MIFFEVDLLLFQYIQPLIYSIEFETKLKNVLHGHLLFVEEIIM